MKFCSLYIIVFFINHVSAQTLLTEHFDSGIFPISGWTNINANGAGSGWSLNTSSSLTFGPYSSYSGSGSMVYEYDPALNANSWSITPPLTLSAGVNYAVTFLYKVEDNFYPEKMKVTFGNGNTIAAQTTVIWNNNGGDSLINTSFQQGVAIFSPATTGTFHVGFNCYSDADNFAITVDDIKIEVLPVAIPSCTNLLLPANNAIGAAIKNLPFSWNTVAGISNYILFLGTSNPPDSFGTTQDTSVLITGLSYGTTYYWTVKPVNLLGSAVGCTINTFTTLNQPPPPANDNCGGAVALSNGVAVQGTTLGASESFAADTCGGYAGDANDDVWYSFTTTQAGDVTVTVLPDTSVDAVVVMYSGNCSVLAKVSCSDNGFEGETETITIVGASAGQTYYFRVYDYYGSGTEGNFTVFASGGAILSVSLIDFKGKKVGLVNSLSWLTNNEINNKGFEIQKSLDGMHFSTISFQPTKAVQGNSNSRIVYQFIDENSQGNNYYRLKQLDKDGRFTLSNVILIKGENAGLLVIASIYPNPAKNFVNVSLISDRSQTAAIGITDPAGKIVSTKKVQLIQGQQNIIYNVERLPSGSYFLRILSDKGLVINSKIVKQ